VAVEPTSLRHKGGCAILRRSQSIGLGGVYDPALDDGVKINIALLHEAGMLRYRKAV
jgi:hypothetical protein